MFRKFLIYATILQSIAMLIALCSLIFLYIDLGHVPFYDDPNPTSYKWYDIICVVSHINLTNILLSFILLISYLMHFIKNLLDKKKCEYCFFKLIYYILSMIFVVWYFYRITGWLVD